MCSPAIPVHNQIKMSSFPSGGGRAYSIGLDAVARSWSSSPTASTWSTHSSSSSSSSTLSESRSHPLAISTKRARAPRKRHNQAYNEAAALLATACPNVFSAKGLLEMCKKKSTGTPFHAESTADLLLLPPCPVLGNTGCLLREYFPGERRVLLEPSRPTSSSERSWTFPSSTSIDFPEPNSPAEVSDEGFDADSILDEVGGGIDGILRNLDMNSVDGTSSSNEVGPYLWNLAACGQDDWKNMRGALRRGSQDGEWWRCRTVEVLELNPELHLAPPAPPSRSKKKNNNKKKKKKVVQTTNKAEGDGLKLGLASSPSLTQQRAAANAKAGLGLKLDYEGVLSAWYGRGSPFSAASESSDATVRF